VWTVDDLREWLDLEGHQEHDALLTALEARSVEMVEAMTGRVFPTAALEASYPQTTEVFDGKLSRVLWLQEEPSTLVSVSTRTGLDVAWVALAATDYELAGRKLIYVWGDWPQGYRNIRAIYRSGYAVGGEPGDIRQAVIELVTWQYRAQRKLTLREAGTIDDLKGVAATVARYRRPVI